MIKIRWKVLVSVIFGSLLLNVILLLAAQKVLLPVMTHLEEERALQQLRLGRDDMYAIVEQLQRVAEDYAAWDDSYAFMSTRDPQFIESNYVASTFSNFNLSFIAYLSPEDELAYGQYFDHAQQSLKPLPEELLHVLVSELLRSEPDGEEDPGTDDDLAGFMRVGKDIYALAVAPILTSELTGPPRGVLMAGRRLDTALLNDISADWGHDFHLRILDSENTARSAQIFQLTNVDREKIEGRFHQVDLFGRPLFDAVASFPREFSSHGNLMLEEMVEWNLVICLFFSLFIYLTVDKALRVRELKNQVESKYRQLSAEFETILNGIPAAMMLVSPELDVLWANKAGAELLSDVSESEHGKYMSRVPYISGFEGPGAVVRALETRQNEKYVGEMEDGRVLEEYAYPMFGDRDQVVSVIRLVADVTQEQRLRQEADQQSRLASIGELAAGVAHEINNPTGMLLLNLSLLSDVFHDIEPILDDEYDRDPQLELGRIPYPTLRTKIPYLLREMTEGGQRVKRIVEDLKGFARRDDDQQAAEFDINDVAEAAVRLVDYQLSKATAHFRVSLAAGLPAVQGHFRRIEQVLVNLLVNSTQALSSREEAIMLRTRISHDGASVIVEVEDQGCGIASADLAKVTDPFFTTRRNDGGTGLGLSLSARIVKEHGGTLDIKSRPGSGTIVSIRLPHARRENETE